MTRGYKGSQEVTGGYEGLQGVSLGSRDYIELLGVRRG